MPPWETLATNAVSVGVAVAAKAAEARAAETMLVATKWMSFTSKASRPTQKRDGAADVPCYAEEGQAKLKISNWKKMAQHRRLFPISKDKHIFP
jgi:hypothetical protein